MCCHGCSLSEEAPVRKAIVNLTIMALLFAIVGGGIWIFANAESAPAEAHPNAVEVTRLRSFDRTSRALPSRPVTLAKRSPRPSGYTRTGVAPVSWTVMDLGERGVAGSFRS